MISYRYVISNRQGLHASNSMSLSRAASDYHIQRQRRGKLQKCAGTYESERQTGRKPCTKDRWSGRKTGCRIFKWITSDDFIIK